LNPDRTASEDTPLDTPGWGSKGFRYPLVI